MGWNFTPSYRQVDVGLSQYNQDFSGTSTTGSSEYTVALTISGSGYAEAYYTDGTGSANSRICNNFSGCCCSDDAEIPVPGGNCIDWIGYETGDTGVRSQSLTTTYTQYSDGTPLTMETLGDNILFSIHAQAHTFD